MERNTGPDVILTMEGTGGLALVDMLKNCTSMVENAAACAVDQILAMLRPLTMPWTIFSMPLSYPPP
ncbi:hypothetical protein Dalk_1283 [Desulfatibacillum aliphaticivorans]|uniref:Uncharacterized protein n=1 Tax=Desulfatibacillum aliphaticivorans TaxID=218208 RepID=B8F9P0_DESAL|nr:hypothetical protein Dalk_1283 [Desulfatibacillum aliphaticivorans]